MGLLGIDGGLEDFLWKVRILLVVLDSIMPNWVVLMVGIGMVVMVMFVLELMWCLIIWWVFMW